MISFTLSRCQRKEIAKLVPTSRIAQMRVHMPSKITLCAGTPAMTLLINKYYSITSQSKRGRISSMIRMLVKTRSNCSSNSHRKPAFLKQEVWAVYKTLSTKIPILSPSSRPHRQSLIKATVINHCQVQLITQVSHTSPAI